MPIFKIPARIIKIIENRVGSLFDHIKGTFLGPKMQGKSAFITFDRNLSLPGLYEAGVRHEGGIPELPVLDTIVDTSANYIDALKHKATNKIGKDLEQHLKENPDATPESIENTLKESWQDVSSQLERIVDSEAQFAKNAGLLNGIIRTNAALGVDEPIVFFMPKMDNDLCKECKRLHLMPDEITPRVWKLSELSHTYHKKGDTVPSIFSPHPHCRCLLGSILDGYGFDKSGQIDYIGKDYRVFNDQRGL